MMSVGFGGASAVRFGTAFAVQRKNYLVALKDGVDAEAFVRKVRELPSPMGDHLGEIDQRAAGLGIVTVNASVWLMRQMQDMPEVLSVDEERTNHTRKS